MEVLLRDYPNFIAEQEALRRGEFLAAYRKFLEDHRADQLKAVRQDAWNRAYTLFGLPTANHALYSLIDPFRRGYFLARDLPDVDIFEMKAAALQDLEALKQAAAGVKPAKSKAAKTQPTLFPPETNEGDEILSQPLQLEPGYLVDYLKRNLEVREFDVPPTNTSTLLGDFRDNLIRYSSPQQHAQCCYCGSSLPATEWMAA